MLALKYNMKNAENNNNDSNQYSLLGMNHAASHLITLLFTVLVGPMM